ncbi:MAG: sensor histidine kinase [Rhodothermales bacterium]
MSDSIPHGLLPFLNVAVLERAVDGSYTLLGEAPAWLRHLWPESFVARRNLHPERTFLFLDHFHTDALEIWNDEDGAYITSEMWTEVDASGQEWLLEAAAMQVEGRSLLLLKMPTITPESHREVLQKSRELNLEHYRLHKEIDRREVLIHCIVHDLSTPLAAINGSLRLLLEDDVVLKDGEQLVHIGLRQIDKLHQMVGGMLAVFSKSAPPDRRAPSGPPPDLAATARELITGLGPIAALKDVRIRLDTDVAEDSPCPVIGEAARLERVLFNLLENALRHAPTGSDVILRLHDEGASIRLSVEDAGEGVPDHNIPRLFAIFAQGSGTTGQAGLGLYFCRITIEGWGGSIGYRPRPRGGACFWFRLPKPNVKS